MTEKREPNIFDLLTAEFWVEFFAQASPSAKWTPIQNFEFNILKAKVLHATAAEELYTIWQNLSEKMSTEPTDSVVIGLALYHVYTEQALVSAVSASEVYFKDRLAYAIQNDKRLLNHFREKGIKVKRILDAGLDLSEDIGILIVENMNFQILDDVQNEYESVFGFEPFTKEELKKLKEIFLIRHLIVHKSGIVDHLFISETGLDHQVGQRLFFERDEILEMIEFIGKIVTKIDSKLNQKLGLEEKP